MRRTLIIIGSVIVVLGVGAALYYIFFMSSSAGVAVAPAGSTDLPVARQNTSGSGTVDTTPSSGSPSTPTNIPVAVSARLVKISTGPVVPGESAVYIPAKNASSTPEVAVNYIERGSGNIFSYLTQTKTLTRTSNKTIPDIQSASWLPNASFAFVRYLSGADFSTINTYALSASSTEGFFLPQDLTGIAVSATNVLALTSGVNGSIASLMRTDGTHITTVFTTPLSALLVSFAGKNQYLAYTKPSATLFGDAFLVDSAGHFSRIAGPKNGLVALASPSGKWVVVSFVVNGALQMQLVNTTTGEALSLPVATIADKCVWTSDDTSVYCGIPISPPTGFQYPDDWYQGSVSFNDRIWKIQVSGRYAQLVLDFPKETKEMLDAEALSVDPQNTVLVFVNKNDDSLWSYQL